MTYAVVGKFAKRAGNVKEKHAMTEDLGTYCYHCDWEDDSTEKAKELDWTCPKCSHRALVELF